MRVPSCLFGLFLLYWEEVIGHSGGSVAAWCCEIIQMLVEQPWPDDDWIRVSEELMKCQQKGEGQG